MDEGQLHTWATIAQFVLAAITLAALLFVNAPYGRYVRKGWGPRIPARLGWVLMEAPAVFFFGWIFTLGEHRLALVPLALFSMWQVHYIHRAFIFPFRMRGNGKQMPALVAALAIVFNSLNAYINARWLSEFGTYDPSWFADPRFIAGVAIFAAGFWINYSADRTLFSLRAPGETGYKIPTGGLYRWVSCPNYLGEIIEWAGFAIACWSLPALAFLVYTAANVGPRAFANHRWYRSTFEYYPADRKALIPFIA